jgi:hypothetical protein
LFREPGSCPLHPDLACPKCVHEFIAAHRSRSLRDEVREVHPTLSGRKLLLDAAPIEVVVMRPQSWIRTASARGAKRALVDGIEPPLAGDP